MHMVEACDESDEQTVKETEPNPSMVLSNIPLASARQVENGPAAAVHRSLFRLIAQGPLKMLE